MRKNKYIKENKYIIMASNVKKKKSCNSNILTHWHMNVTYYFCDTKFYISM